MNHVKTPKQVSFFLFAVVFCLSACTSVHDWRFGSGVCEVHHVAMQTQVVHNINGACILFTPGYNRALERSFPNAGIDYAPQFYGPKRGKIYVCPLCVKAKDKYVSPK